MSHRPRAVAGLDKRMVESLSDSIFAFAMTLLVLNLKVPDVGPGVSDAALVGALLAMWPRFAIYAMGFLVIGIYWVGQHAQFQFLRVVDRTFVWLSNLFLMAVVLMPFSMAFLAAYPMSRVAIGFYAANVILNGVIQLVRWNYAANHHLLDAHLPEGTVEHARRKISRAPLLYLGAFALSFIHPGLALAGFAAIAAGYLLLGGLDKSLRHRHAHAAVAEPHAVPPAEPS